MRTFTVKNLVPAALVCAAMVSALTARAQEKAPPQPPLPPLPPAVTPEQFKIFTPSPTQRPAVPATGPAVVPPAPVFVPPQTQFVAPVSVGPLTNFTWDAEQKEYTTKPEDMVANFTFWFTNISPGEVTINAVRTSCGCTVAKLPPVPWHIPAGTNGPIEVTVDLRGKQGTIAKAVTVESSAGTKSLIVKMNITPPTNGLVSNPLPTGFNVPHPVMGDADRLKNMQESLKDRQVVFKDAKCATCHADPAKGQVDGAVIYRGVCFTCHDSPLRAAAVTDLKALKNETDIDYWKQWITHGREGGMMPAFSQARGGPLNEQQINALAAYCLITFKPVIAGPAKPAAVATNAAVSVPSLPSISVFPAPAAK